MLEIQSDTARKENILESNSHYKKVPVNVYFVLNSYGNRTV